MPLNINNSEISQVVDIWFGFHNPPPSMKTTFLRNHPILSNLHPRPFHSLDGRRYVNAEHAFQTWRTGKFNSTVYLLNWEKCLSFHLGVSNNIDDLTRERSLLKRIICQSLIQNKDVLDYLLATGDRLITHRNERNPYWRREFPAILMELRNEMRTI